MVAQPIKLLHYVVAVQEKSTCILGQITSGDGIAMGWRVGATVANMEFSSCLLISSGSANFDFEALRGAGGLLNEPMDIVL